MGAAITRFFRGGFHGVTILVVEDSATPPKGVKISYFGLGLCIAGFIGIMSFTAIFAIGAFSEKSRMLDSGGELATARKELDSYREGAIALSEAYAALSRSLSAVASSVQKEKPKAGFAPLLAVASAADKASKYRGEARGIAEASAGLEAAIAPLEELGKFAGSMAEIEKRVPALWPIKGSTGHLSATYGPNPNPFTGEPYFHPGIDCSNYREGDPIVATADGVVVFAGSYYGYGRSVVLDHPNGYFTRYGHMQRILVRDGQRVKQGQVIGIVGNTGNSTGPHVHYEVFIGNTRTDPIDYLWAAEDRKAPEGTVPFGQE